LRIEPQRHAHLTAIPLNQLSHSTRTTNSESNRAEEIHFRVLRLLEARPELTQRQLAQELGISLGKANYCVKAMLEKG